MPNCCFTGSPLWKGEIESELCDHCFVYGRMYVLVLAC